jgi:tripartite-type tricarboxylate transporter receptor subunit TctC
MLRLLSAVSPIVAARLNPGAIAARSGCMLAVSRIGLALFTWLAFISPVSLAHAAWPERPISIVVPYAAGGAADVTVRVIAEKMSAQLGQPVLIINRPGSVVATSSVARAAPDGYTFMAAPMSHSMNTAMYTRLPYDTFNDFVPVATFGYFNYVIVASKSLGIKDLQGLIASLKANPGRYNFGSGGVGSPTHLVVELFKSLTKTSATHVPYRADQLGLTDLMAGRIDFMIPSTVAGASQVKGGTVLALAVPSPKRSASLPEVPTTTEAGLPEFQVSSYYVLIAPKDTPVAVVEQVNAIVNRSLQDAGALKRLADLDFSVQQNSTPASTAALIRTEADRWAPIIKNAGITLE